jgi:hypothetical protein
VVPRPLGARHPAPVKAAINDKEGELASIPLARSWQRSALRVREVKLWESSSKAKAATREVGHLAKDRGRL